MKKGYTWGFTMTISGEKSWFLVSMGFL
jgi:hypothetical protein